MKKRVDLKVRRYLNANEFTSGLKQLQAFRGTFVSNDLLEALESDGLIRPRLRLRWPDPIARRLWLEEHDGIDSLHEIIEPDGARWDAANNLVQALNNRCINSDAPHPFDDPDPMFAKFLQTAQDQEFLPHQDRKVSVSCNKYPELYDSGNVKDFYTGWQVLAAAEVADMGIHIRMNTSDSQVVEDMRSAVHEKRLPKGHTHLLYAPIRAMKGLVKHEATLDAIVWSVEEGSAALSRITGSQGSGRFRLTEDQDRQYREAQNDAARSGSRRYGVESSDVIAACQFLAQRWSDWNSEGRPLISDAYKIYLASAVRLLQMTTDMTFGCIRDAVGHQGSSSKPTLDVVWPDWAGAQKERIARTLQGVVAAAGPGALSADEIAAFGDFVEQKYQDAIFLRIESFVRHAFEEMNAPMAGMSSDLQGMAVAVEQAVRAMGGTKDQLFQMFRELWLEPDVARLLKSKKTLAEQRRTSSQWPSLKVEIEQLRSSGPAEAVAADLIMASRLRGAVHHQLPEKDQFELERLFVVLLRAVAMTHAHVQRRRSDIVRPGGEEKQVGQ